MHYSTREFWKVKGIHKIFIIFSRSKKRGMVSFLGRTAGKRFSVGRCVWHYREVAARMRCHLISLLRRQLPLKGKPGAAAEKRLLRKKPSPRGEGGTAAAVTDEVGRESLRQPIRSVEEKSCCIIRGGRTLNFGAAVGGLRLRGANSFIITAVKLWRGRDATSSVGVRRQLPLKGKPGSLQSKRTIFFEN